jgi:hypothetical protein
MTKQTAAKSAPTKILGRTRLALHRVHFEIVEGFGREALRGRRNYSVVKVCALLLTREVTNLRPGVDQSPGKLLFCFASVHLLASLRAGHRLQSFETS